MVGDPHFPEPLPPGSFGCPFLGSNVFAGDKDDGPEAFYSRQSEKLGNPRIWKFGFWGTDIVSVSGTKNLREILGQEFKTLSSPTSQRFFTDPFAGEMRNIVFEPDQEKHRFLRGIMGKFMSPAAVAEYMPQLQLIANERVDHILAAGTTSVRMEDECAEYAVDITQKLLLGLDLETASGKKTKFVESVRAWASSLEVLNLEQQKCWFAALAKLVAGIKGIVFIKATIEEKIEYLRTNGPDGTLLSEMVFATNDDGSNRLTQEEIVQNAIVVTFAGYDTTRCTLSFVLFLLGSHSDVWEKVVTEQKEVYSRYGDELTRKILDQEFSYLDTVLKESLRLGTVSIAPPRKTTQTMIVDGIQIPKGWTVACSIRQTHVLDPVTYREDKSHMDVMKGFDPDRWLHEETRPRDYIPFGVGPRSCLGGNLALADMKIFISTFARRVDFDLVGSKGTNVEWSPTSVIKKPADGVPILARPVSS